jgi:hypothetical protein
LKEPKDKEESMAIDRKFHMGLPGQLLTFLGGLLLVVLLSGCSSGGDGKAQDDPQSNPDPQVTNGSTWDQMAWDQGKWK